MPMKGTMDFLDALKDNNIFIHKNLIYRGDYTFKKGFEGANYLT